MSRKSIEPGKTQAFVTGTGFEERHEKLMLFDQEGNGRLFFELTADPDHARYSPEMAYGEILRSMLPGISIRFLQINWPGMQPRKIFLEQLSSWPQITFASKISLNKELFNFLSSMPLPFYRRVFLECVITNPEMMGWVYSFFEIFKGYGIQVHELTPAEVQSLAQWILNPELG